MSADKMSFVTRATNACASLSLSQAQRLSEIKMLFIIHAVDRTDALPTRLANYEAHKAFLSDTSRFGVGIVMSGPLVADDGKTMIGSLFLVEAPSRTEVEAFHGADPFFTAGIWEKVTITGFLRRQG
jgi:uncharacterized protein